MTAGCGPTGPSSAPARAGPPPFDASRGGALVRPLVAGLDAASGPDRIAVAKDSLRNLGYVWRPRAEPVWEPGIPSLMDYVLEHAPVTRSS